MKTACKEVDAPTEAIAFSRYLERHPELRRLIDNAPAGPPALVTKTDTSVQGFRDGADPVIEEQTPKAIRAVAQGLVDLGMFDSVSTAIKHMRTSPRYAALFTAPARYRDSVGEILAVPR